jgi:hypothetical protein
MVNGYHSFGLSKDHSLRNIKMSLKILQMGSELPSSTLRKHCALSLEPISAMSWLTGVYRELFAQQFRQPDRSIASRCSGRLRPTLAPMLNFNVYADGSDLDQCEDALIKAFSNFASSQTIATSVVNDRKLRTPDLKDEDLPDWNLPLLKPRRPLYSPRSPIRSCLLIAERSMRIHLMPR